MQMGSSKGEQTINNFIESNRIEIISESNQIVFFSAESPSTSLQCMPEPSELHFNWSV